MSDKPVIPGVVPHGAMTPFKYPDGTVLSVDGQATLEFITKMMQHAFWIGVNAGRAHSKNEDLPGDIGTFLNDPLDQFVKK